MSPCPPRIATDRARVGVVELRRCRARAGSRADASRPRAPRRRSSACVSSGPSTAVAKAMIESGCRWSTWASSTRACMAVSMLGAAPPRPKQAVVEQRHHLVFVLRSRGRHRRGERTRLSSSAARPDSVNVPRSPPEPLTYITGTELPVAGSRGHPLRGGVAACVVGVPPVGAEVAATGDQLGRGTCQAVHVLLVGGLDHRRVMPPSRPPRHHPIGFDPLVVAGRRVGRPTGLRPIPCSARSSASSGRTSVANASIEGAVRSEHVTGPLRRREPVAIDEQRLRSRLLHVHHGSDLAGEPSARCCDTGRT